MGSDVISQREVPSRRCCDSTSVMMNLLRITVTSVLNAHAHEVSFARGYAWLCERPCWSHATSPCDELPPELGRPDDGAPHNRRTGPLPCTGSHHGPVQDLKYLATPLIGLAWRFLASGRHLHPATRYTTDGSLVLTVHDREDKT
jgi:hypothetical protein